MTTYKSTINVNVTDNGSTKVTAANVKNLNDILLKTEAQAKRTSAVIPNTSGNTAKMMADKAAADRQDYNRAKGLGGLTGAEGRDFAKQSQGLGGVVRLYATYAANIFAVSAAYTALSKAADTTNMIKGLDQLGAASGRNLGTLAKNIAEVTDGAVSLRDAMTATAQATSGGMTSANILRMANIAKNASQALGVAMPDALARLSRGITKLEPELLDEIGIMVRVDDAVDSYARTLGKSAAALTDFERRQGFANAVIEQGERKFGQISMQANPYSKLTASIQNLTQETLALVNKGLGPIVELLASSPTALTAIFAGLGGILLKQAIPAIGQYRQHLNDTLEETRKKVSAIYALQTELGAEADNIAAKQATNAFKQSDAVVRRLTALQANAKQFTNTSKTDWAGKAGADPFKMSDADIKSISARASALKKSNEVEANLMRNHVNEIKKIRSEMYFVADEAAARNETNNFHQRNLAIIRDKANIAASNAEIKAITAQTQAVFGAKAAWSKLNEEILLSKNGMRQLDTGRIDQSGNKILETVKSTNALTNGVTRLGGAVSIATGTVSTMLSAFGNWFAIVTIALAALALLDSWLTSNAKQMQEFEKATTTATEAVDTLSRTIDKMESSSKLGEAFSVQTIQARATAVQELSDSLNAQIKAADKARDSMGRYDKFKEGFKGIFGFGVTETLEDNLVLGVSKAFDALNTPDLKAKANEALIRVLGSTDLTEKSLAKFNKTQRESKLKELAVELTALSHQSSNAASSLSSFANVLEETNKLSKDISNSLIPTDNLSKMGANALSVGQSIIKVMEDVKTGAEGISSIGKSAAALTLFGPESQKAIMDYSSRLDESRNKIISLRTEVKNAEKALNDMGERGFGEYNETQAKRRRNEVAVSTTRKSLAKEELEAENIAIKFSKLAGEAIANGVKLLETALETERQKGIIAIEKARLSALSTLPGAETALEMGRLMQEELEIQKGVISTTLANTLATEKLRIQLAMNADRDELSRQEASGVVDPVVAQRLNDSFTTNTKILNALENPDNIKSIVQGLSSSSDKISINVASSLATLLPKIMGSQSAIAGISAQQEVARRNAYSNVTDEDVKRESEIWDLERRRLELAKQAQQLTKGISLERDAEIVSATALLDIEIQNTEIAKLSLKYRGMIAKAQGAGADSKVFAAINESQAKDLAEANIKVADIQKNSLNEIAKLRFETFKKETEEQNKRRDFALEEQSDAIELSKVILTERQKLLESSEALLQTTTYDLEKQQQAIDKSKALNTELDNRKLKEAEIALAAEQARNAVNTRPSELVPGGLSDSQKALEVLEINKATATELTRINAIYDSSVARINSQFSAQTRVNEATQKAAVYQAELNDLTKKHELLLEDVTTAADSLANVFGEVGSAVGDSLKIFAKSFADREKLEKQHMRKLEVIQADGPPDPAELAKEDKKYNKERQASELSMYGALTKGAKAMFGEKSGLAKTFGALEKTMHAYKLAMNVAEIASEVAKTGTIIGIKIPAIMATMFSQLGIFAPAAIAVALAAIGAAGGGGSMSSIGMTAEDRQATQGTGRTYKDGKLTEENGGGALGYAGEQNADIVNSIEILSNLQVDGIQIFRDQLRELEQIKANTKNVAEQAYKVQGLTGGLSGFGTTEKSNPGFLGLFAKSTSIIDSGIKALQGATVDTIAELLTQYETVQKTSSGFLGIGGGTKIKENQKSLDVEFAQDIGGLFQSGKRVLTSALSSLGAGVQESLDSVVGSFDVSDFRTSMKDLEGDELVDALMATIGETLSVATKSLAPYLTDFRQLGEGLYGTAVRVNAELEYTTTAMTFLGNSLNLVPQIVDEVTASTLESFSTAQKAVADARKTYEEANKATFMSLQGTGENGYYLSVGDPEKVKEAREALEEATDKYIAAEAALGGEKYASITANIKLTQSLINAAGGIDKFQEKFDFYMENFLTEAERMERKLPLVTAQIASLEKQFPNLGIASIKTRDDLNTVVQALDLTGESGIAAFTALLDFAPNLAAVTQDLVSDTVKYLDGLSDASDKMSSKEDIAKKRRELEIRIMELEGDAIGALAARRSDELTALHSSLTPLQKRVWLLEDEEKRLEALTALEYKIMELTKQSAALNAAKREEELKSLSNEEIIRKKYIYALEDEEDLRTQLLNAYSKEQTELKSTIDRLKQATKTLKDFKDQLLLGDKSPLTPAQKYEEAKRQALQVATIASSIARTEEEQIAKAEAITKLPSVANSFLEASKNYYASSDQYQKDFQMITGFVDSLSLGTEGLLTEAEKQLATAKTMAEHLDFIKTNTATSAELLPKFLEAIKETLRAQGTAAQGGSTSAGNAPSISDKYNFKEDINTGSSYYSASGAQGQKNSITGVMEVFSKQGANLGTVTQVKDYILNQMSTKGNAGALEVLNLARQYGISMSALDAILEYPKGTVAGFATSMGIPAFKNGGLASGMAMINETGPELVNFEDPGRVFSHEQTRGMFNGTNLQLIKEVKNLKDAVEKLTIKQEQLVNKQIIAMYDAETNAANTVVTGITNVSQQVQWNKESSGKLK